MIKLVPNLASLIIIVGLLLTSCNETDDIYPAMKITLTDSDGNTYKTLKIGKQVWMAENLKVTKCKNGDPIPLVTDNKEWLNLEDNNTDKAYCFYDNDETLGYGALYTFAAAKDACPVGWHLPSDSEWNELEKYLINTGFNYDGSIGGENKIAKALASTTGWEISNSIGDIGNNPFANNNSRFSALAAGQRSSGSFETNGYYTAWWTSNEATAEVVYTQALAHIGVFLAHSAFHKSGGLSIRCIKD